MAYRFALDEDIGDGFARIARQQIDKALGELDGAADAARAVHETRKALKRVRALLRLVRPGLNEKVFAFENERFRGVGALLSGARDAGVALETLNALGGSRNAAVAVAVAAAREKLGDAPQGDSSGAADGLRQAAARLRAAKRAFARMAQIENDFSLLARGAETVYAKGLKTFGAAYDGGDDEAFHDWRKNVQRHWRHMTLLSEAWPEAMKARAAEARALAQEMGHDHDLSVLARLADERLGAKHASVIREQCEARQRQLRAAAHPRGRRLYAEKPRRLRRALELHWALAMQMSDADGAGSARESARARKDRL